MPQQKLIKFSENHFWKVLYWIKAAFRDLCEAVSIELVIAIKIVSVPNYSQMICQMICQEMSNCRKLRSLNTPRVATSYHTPHLITASIKNEALVCSFLYYEVVYYHTESNFPYRRLSQNLVVQILDKL